MIRLGLGLRLGLGFIFYVYFIFTKPTFTALSSCVTVTSQVEYIHKLSNFKIHRYIYSHCLYLNCHCVMWDISVVTTFIKTYKTERFTVQHWRPNHSITRHLLNRTFCNGVGGRTTGLQTPRHLLNTIYCSL